MATVWACSNAMTGRSAAGLRQVCEAYGQPAQTLPGGAMAGHADIAFGSSG
jgi:hypothetical protein